MNSPVLSPNFMIGYIRIGSIEAASCLNMGNNWPSHFVSHKKHNQGFGNIGGDNNHIKGAQSFLNDPDVIDAMSINDGEPPQWLMDLLTRSSQPIENTREDTQP